MRKWKIRIQRIPKFDFCADKRNTTQLARTAPVVRKIANYCQIHLTNSPHYKTVIYLNSMRNLNIVVILFTLWFVTMNCNNLLSLLLNFTACCDVSSFLVYTAGISLIVKLPKIALKLNSSNKSGSCHKAFWYSYLLSTCRLDCWLMNLLCLPNSGSYIDIFISISQLHAASPIFYFYIFFTKTANTMIYILAWLRKHLTNAHQLEASNNSLKMPNSVFIFLKMCAHNWFKIYQLTSRNRCRPQMKLRTLIKSKSQLSLFSFFSAHRALTHAIKI